MKDITQSYDDIIAFPHHRSKTHPPMSIQNRAAQFSPFAALTGYDEAVKETARLTDEKTELSEDALASLSEKLKTLGYLLKDRPSVSVIWFRPDQRKEGGSYLTSRGVVTKIDEYRRILRLEDGTEIPFDAVSELLL